MRTPDAVAAALRGSLLMSEMDGDEATATTATAAERVARRWKRASGGERLSSTWHSFSVRQTWREGGRAKRVNFPRRPLSLRRRRRRRVTGNAYKLGSQARTRGLREDQTEPWLLLSRLLRRRSSTTRNIRHSTSVSFPWRPLPVYSARDDRSHAARWHLPAPAGQTPCIGATL